MKKLAAAAMLLLAVGFVFQTEAAAAAVFKGLSAAFVRVIPALLPISVLAGTAVSMGLFDGVCRALAPLMRLFGLPGPAVLPLVLGMLGGYPLGAQVTAGLLENGALTKRQAEAALGFCSNAGPAFILGVAGASVFQSAQTGALLLASHVLAALGTGLLLALFSKSEPFEPTLKSPPLAESFGAAFSKAVQSSAMAMLRVAFYIAFFFYVTEMLSFLPVAGLGGFSWLFFGLIEISGGLLRLGPGQEAAAAFLLGAGGLCIFFQTAGTFAGRPISLKRYALGKLCQGGLAVLLYKGFSEAPVWLLLLPGILLLRLLLLGAKEEPNAGKRRGHRV